MLLSARPAERGGPVKARLCTLLESNIYIILRAQGFVAAHESFHLKASLFSAMLVVRMIPAEVVGEPANSSRSSRRSPRVLTTGVVQQSRRLVTSETRYEDSSIRLLVPAKMIGSIVSRPMRMLNDSFGRAMVALAKVVFRSIRDISQTAPSTLGQDVLETSWRFEYPIGCDCLPVALSHVFNLWRDRCRDFTTQSARGFDLDTVRGFILSYDRDLDIIVDNLSRPNGCRAVERASSAWVDII